jgi:hypothetical protein
MHVTLVVVHGEASIEVSRHDCYNFASVLIQWGKTETGQSLLRKRTDSELPEPVQETEPAQMISRTGVKAVCEKSSCLAAVTHTRRTSPTCRPAEQSSRAEGGRVEWEEGQKRRA